MLDEDIFDSVTWETPSANRYDSEAPSNGPGYRQSTVDSGEGTHEPKWEGYLITSVKDPVKELAETKDAYVSYLVTAEVFLLHALRSDSNWICRRIYQLSPLRLARPEGGFKTLFF